MKTRNNSTQVWLCFLVMMVLMVTGCGSIENEDSAYGISGTATISSVAFEGVTINLTGTATASTTTNSSGNFSFTELAKGTYTVTPVKTGYTFDPVCTVVIVKGADVAEIDFAATAAGASTYGVSGSVTGSVKAGVTISLSGDTTGTAITNVSGNYAFSNLPDGSYTVTPSLTGYTFSPTRATITVSGADVDVDDFVATAND